MQEAVSGQSLKAVGRPSIEDLKFEDQGPLSFKAVVEVKPEFQLGTVEGLAISGPSDEVSDAEVEAQVDGLRQRAAKPGEPKDGPLALGDWVKMDFQGFIEGKPFPGGQATDYVVVLGRKQLIPGFEDQLVGAKAGEARQVKVSFPKDYPAQDVAGKDAEFLVTVKEARDLILPVVDEAFAKTFGPEVTGVDFLRDRLREAVGLQKTRARTQRLMDAAAEELLKVHRFPVPTCLIEAEAEALERGELGRLSGQGMELNGQEGRESLRKALREPAEKRARLSLLLEKIAENKGIAAEDADFDAEMGRLAGQMRTSAAEATRSIRESGREAGVREQIRERKALNWV
ncbi:MAG: trigger factor, partial [bacterium]